MVNHRQVWGILFVAVLLLVGCESSSVDTAKEESQDHFDGTSSSFLLTVAEVSDLLASSAPPLLLEISKPGEFAKGHLAGAVNLWRPDYEDRENYPYGGIRASRAQMTDLLNRIGAKNDSLLVVYCTKGSADAARFMWIMRGYGHDRIAMMDGGKIAWQHAGLPLTQDTTLPLSPSDYQFPRGFQQNDYASFHDVLAAMSDTNTVIVDTREDYEYLGTPYLTGDKIVPFKPGGFIHGAIPGAVHLNWSESVDLHGDHTFKSLKNLAYNFKKTGVTPDKKIIVYCQSGVRSSHTAFVLSELLGYPDVSNYDGSWIEWSYLHQHANLVPIKQHSSPEANAQIHEELVANLAVTLKQ